MPGQKFISLLIPTYNEADNIQEVLRRSIGVLDGCGCDYEVLVVDDSPGDSTAEAARAVLGAKGKVITRKGKKAGLSESIIDGIKESSGQYILIMDADGSHPPELIAEFIKTIRQGYDLVIASRYIKGGGIDKFPGYRRAISYSGCLVGRLLTGIRDNTSGFFCVSRRALEGVPLTANGFKIGLEIFVKAKFRAFKEIPYIFTDRKKGKSKLSSKVIFQYFEQFFRLLKYRFFNR